jgi:hypothetical protein
MIVIWRGAGPLVLLFGIISAVVLNVVTSSAFHQDNYFASHSWSQAVALWTAGVASWFAGKYLNGQPGKEIIDSQTGQRIIQRPNHHLMFIKVEYWGPIYFVIGAVVLIVGIVKR